MSTSSLFVEGGARFIPHIIRLRKVIPDLRAAMAEVWDCLGDLNTLNETMLPDHFTDYFLAAEMGRSPRFVQKGLKGLQDAGVIFRHTSHGRRNIEITGRIAGRKKDHPRGRKSPSKQAAPPETAEQIKAREAVDKARDERAKEIWESLTQTQQDEIRAKIRLENPTLKHWDNVIESMSRVRAETEFTGSTGSPENPRGP